MGNHIKSLVIICLIIIVDHLNIISCCMIQRSTSALEQRSKVKDKLVPWSKTKYDVISTIRDCGSKTDTLSYYYAWRSQDPKLIQAPNGQSPNHRYHFYKIGQTDNKDQFKRYAPDFARFIKIHCASQRKALIKINNQINLIKSRMKMRKYRNSIVIEDQYKMSVEIKEERLEALKTCESEQVESFKEVWSLIGAIRCGISSDESGVMCMDYCFRAFILDKQFMENKRKIVFRLTDHANWLISGYDEFHIVSFETDIIAEMADYFSIHCGYKCSTCALKDNGLGFGSLCE